MIDVKPFGAFIEYTLKPLVDDARELLEIIEQRGIPANRIFSLSWRLYIFDKVVSLIQTIIVTGMICGTLWLFLSSVK